VPAAAPAAAPAASAPPGATAKDGINVKHTGDYDQALLIFDANLTSNASDPLALWGKAWIQAERGQKPDATTTFKSFLGVSKDAPKVKETKAALKRLGG
jgi:hypothetical protein